MSNSDHLSMLKFIGRYSDVLGKDTVLQITQKTLVEDFHIRAPKLITILERRLDEENIPVVKKYIPDSKCGLYYYGDLCSHSALADFEGAPLIKIEERIDSEDVSWSITGPLYECSELRSHTSVSIDDVFSLIQKDWMNVDENSIATLYETIHEINLSNDGTMLTIKTKSFQIVAKIDNKRQYGERYGGFMLCEDAYDAFVGSMLKRVYLTDTFCQTIDINIIKKLPGLLQNDIEVEEAKEADPESIHYYVDTEGNKWGCLSNISFINFETGKGVLQFVVYNMHNGYYGHDVSISINRQIVYKTNI